MTKPSVSGGLQSPDLAGTTSTLYSSIRGESSGPMAEKVIRGLSTETLKKLEIELERKLLESHHYQDLLTVKAELLARKNADDKSLQAAAGKIVTRELMEYTYSPRAIRLGRITALAAAVRALKEAGRPMDIHELVEAVRTNGFEFGGKKSPASALATYLSKPRGNSPVVSIWVDNKPMWWLRDRPVPGAVVLPPEVELP